MLAYGVERRELSHNVAASMKKVPRVRREMATYTPDEIRRVLRAADKDRSGHLWYLALSGLRRGEIAGLRWSDIDFDAGTHHDCAESGSGRCGQRRRERAEDVVVVSHAAARRGAGCRAQACLSRYAQEKLALGEAHADSGYVAVNEAGEPYTPDTLTRMWHKLTESAGVRPIRLHDARHSCGTALHLRGVPLAVIAKWLGHADAATTARIYAHSQDDALRAAGQSLGAVVTSS